MTEPLWTHHDPTLLPRQAAGRFAATHWPEPRRVESLAGRDDVGGGYHGIFTVAGEDREFELLGRPDGTWEARGI